MYDSTVMNIILNKCAMNALNPMQLWHLRLGHVRDTKISKLENNGLIGLLGEESYLTCEPCILSKIAKNPFDGHVERSTKVLELVHANIRGPFNEMARGGLFLYHHNLYR